MTLKSRYLVVRDEMSIPNPSPSAAIINTSKGITLLYFDRLVYVKTSEIDPRDKTAILADGTKIQLKNISFEKLLSLLFS